MRRAIRLARRGLGRVSPNPLVGCVLVAPSGRVVGEGWHARFGAEHAEAMALRRAGGRARGATAYTNLEPCCHEDKKTPPCAPALARAGVRRVVAAMRDPNPSVLGRGLGALESAGVRVRCGLLEDEARALNRPFVAWIKRGRPHVILKAAASLDGRIEDARGRSKWITSPQARALGRRLRSACDAILVGVGTVLADDPRLTAAGRRNPLRVVLDPRLRTPRWARVLGPEAPTLIATSLNIRPRYPLPPSVSLLRLPLRGGGIDLKALLRALARRGVASLLVEGGSRVHTSFLEAGLVDELRLFLAPRLLGGESARGFFEGRGFPLEKAPYLRDAQVRRVGPDLLMTGLF